RDARGRGSLSALPDGHAPQHEGPRSFAPRSGANLRRGADVSRLSDRRRRRLCRSKHPTRRGASRTMTLELPQIESDHFSADAGLEGKVVRVRFAGNADLTAREALERLLVKLHDEVIRLSCTEVIVDFHELEFMNSSCFKSFVAWINSVQELETGKQYRIRMLSDPAMLWQRRSLHALKCFAVNLIEVES